MKKLLILLACAATPSSLFAEQWQVLGTRPMGMGGAFVAVAQGPIAQYWNPAGLVKSSANVSGMDIPVGVTAEFTGDIIKNASQIGDTANSFAATQNSQRNGGTLGPKEVAAFVKTVSLMEDMNEPGKGALFQVAGGANFKFSKVALSVNNYTSVGLNPFIDTTNIGLGDGTGLTGVDFGTVSNADPAADKLAARNSIVTAINTIGFSNLKILMCGVGGCTSSGATPITTSLQLANVIVNSSPLSAELLNESAATLVEYAAAVAPIVNNAVGSPTNSYTNNQSNLTVVGASFVEIAAGYAWNVDKWMHGLSLGANFKLINGRTAVTSFRFLSESDTGDAFKMENMKSSWKPALDLGLLWNVNSTYPKFPLRPKVGLVMRNINSPSFDTSSGGDYDLDRQVRLGFALNPTKFWTLAMDLDLTKNKTPVRGFDSRQLCLGTEINLINRKAFNIPLRAGIMSNLAEKDSKMAYTAGTGINLLFMHFDVSAVVSSEKTELDGEAIPTKVGIAASFGLLF